VWIWRTYLHFREEAVHEVDGAEQDVGGQVVPHLEAAEHMCGAIADAGCHVHVGVHALLLGAGELQVRLELALGGDGFLQLGQEARVRHWVDSFLVAAVHSRDVTLDLTPVTPEEWTKGWTAYLPKKKNVTLVDTAFVPVIDPRIR